MKVTVLSGGVGGARFLRGVVAVVDPGNVSIIGNVGDDIEVLGLHVSPDLDSILYALAGRRRRGARLGPRRRDLERARDRGASSAARPGSGSATAISASISSGRSCCATGAPLSEATEQTRARARARCALLPATDDPLRTFLETPAGTFPFQTWFVARGHRDEVDAVHYAGSARGRRGAGRDRGDRRRGRDRDRAEQSVRLDRADPRGRRDPARARAAARSVRCRQPARSAAAPSRARPTGCSRRLAGGTSPAHVAGVLRGADRRARDRRGRRPGRAPVRGVRPVVTRTLMTDDGAARRLAAAALDAAGALA